MGLGRLTLRNSKSLALSGVKLGSDGVTLYLQRFFDKMDLSLGLLVKTGAGLLGYNVMSRKSLYVVFHLFVSISCTVGRSLVNWMHSGVGLSLSNLLTLGFNIVSLLACFISQILFSMCLLYPLRAKCFTSFLLYFRQTIGDLSAFVMIIFSFFF